MVRQSAKVILLEILAGLVVLSIAAFAILAIRLSSGPIELGFLKDRIERTLENNRDGRNVSLENISLEWLSKEKRAVVTASNLVLYNDAHEAAAEAERVEILLDITGLFVGKVRPVGLVMKDGWIVVHQGEAGWSVAGDPVGSQQIVASAREPVRLKGLLEATNQTLSDVLSLLRRDARALPLERLEFEGLDFIFTQSGIEEERARFTDAVGGFVRDGDGIGLELKGRSLGDEATPGLFEASINAPGDYANIDAQIIFHDWSLEAVSNVFPATAGTVSDLPASLTIGLRATLEEGLEQVRFTADTGAGQVRYQGASLDIAKAGLDGEYFPATDQLDLKLNDFDLGPLSGNLSITIEDLLKTETVRRFSLDSPGLQIDATPRFSDVWQPRRIKATGTLDLNARQIDIETARLDIDEATLRTSGKVTVLQNLQGRDLPVEADLSAEVTGPLLLDQFMRFWPVKQAPGARGYVNRIVKQGYISGASAQINLRRDSFSEGYLADEALTASFSIADARINPLHDIPEVDRVNGVGQMTGNSMLLSFEDARIANWVIDKGTVHYPRLSPAGADMTVSIQGRGSATDLVQMVSDSRLQLQARSGLNPANVSGEAAMSLTMTRPAKPNVPLSEYRYTGKGTVKSGGLAQAFNGLALADSTASVDLTEKGIRIAGLGKIGNSPLDYDWHLTFGENAPPALLKAKTLFTPDILNSFGIVGRAYVTGEAPVELEARLDGSQVRAVDAAFDLLGMRLDIAEVNWVKPIGKAASASIRYEVDEGAPTTAVTLNTDGAAFDGTFTLADDGQLISGNIERAILDNRLDLSGTASRTDAGVLQFKLAGDLLDLSRFVPGAAAINTNSDTEAVTYGDVLLDAEIKRLRLRPGFETSDTRLSLVSDQDGVQTIEASGQLPNKADIRAAYDASGLGDPTFLINSGDASFLASVFLGFDSLEGGTLEMSGTLPSEDEPTQVRLVIENGRLKDAPFVTQILSLASIRGLSDTLSGDGVLFTIAELPLLIDEGRFIIAGARASGPALGLTANGVIVPEKGEIDIDGVLVPSFGLNSALGGIPVIGDLFVSRQGEGLISLRYNVEGTFDKAQVSVNPLSAIAPGVLRRIFENPENDDLIPSVDAEAKDEAEPIPGE